MKRYKVNEVIRLLEKDGWYLNLETGRVEITTLHKQK